MLASIKKDHSIPMTTLTGPVPFARSHVAFSVRGQCEVCSIRLHGVAEGKMLLVCFHSIVFNYGCVNKDLSHL